MKRSIRGQGDVVERFSFACIRFMHDNRLLRKCVDPAALLRELGLQEGDRVFEVGCGPGFFTVGAAEAAGSAGDVAAFDVNPYACRYTEDKVRRLGLKQVRVEHRNAADSGFDNGSVDFAFVVGVPHIVGGAHNLMHELGRVVRQGGLLAYRPSRGNVEGLVEAAETQGFRQEGTVRRFLLFRKT